jgi:DNA-binding response OmpR family regulator
MAPKIKILLVEDDLNLGTILKEFLAVKGFAVSHVLNGEEGFSAFIKERFDICLLDVMMPKMDGFTLARKIRSGNSTIPFLFVTAKSMIDDKMEGFKCGADDYITKPFSMEELILRINAVLRRTASGKAADNEKTVFEIGIFNFNCRERTLLLNGAIQKLTSKESELLRLLCLNENKVLERSEALTRLWNEDNYFTSRSMDVYITRLRNYLKPDKSIQIMNVHGTGFKLLHK